LLTYFTLHIVLRVAIYQSVLLNKDTLRLTAGLYQ